MPVFDFKDVTKVTITITHELAALVDAIADDTGKNRSAVLEDLAWRSPQLKQYARAHQVTRPERPANTTSS